MICEFPDDDIVCVTWCFRCREKCVFHLYLCLEKRISGEITTYVRSVSIIFTFVTFLQHLSIQWHQCKIIVFFRMLVIGMIQQWEQNWDVAGWSLCVSSFSPTAYVLWAHIKTHSVSHTSAISAKPKQKEKAQLIVYVIKYENTTGFCTVLA